MNNEDFLRNIKDDLLYCLKTSQTEEVKRTLNTSIKKIEAQLNDPEVQPKCGLYLFDGGRTYGYSYENLDHLLTEYFNPRSVFYKYKRGFPRLLEWLYDVSRTSIGDLHGDLFKDVTVRYYRPEDFGDEEAIDKRWKKYDDFWDRVEQMIVARSKENGS